MSHKKTYRKDKTCLNCRFVVEQKFCPNCGQENTDTRKSFHHLFVHFFEDLTHYENAFWRTIKNLLFRPSSLTKEYLSGKRLSYLAPVRLYIFISFLTFFILTLLPSNDLIKQKSAQEKSNDSALITISRGDDSLVDVKYQKKLETSKLSKSEKEIEAILDSKKISDSTKLKLQELLKIANERKQEKKSFINLRYNNMADLNKAKAKGTVNATTYWFLKKSIQIREKYSTNEILEKANESAKHNFPKVLLIYMPIFAFSLWVFQNKKKWYYFDHGIFTLHYFSFLLLIFLLIIITIELLDFCGTNTFLTVITAGIKILSFGWMLYYFFPAHHRFYGESRRRSFVKCMLLFFINMIIILFLMVFFFLYTLISIK